MAGTLPANAILCVDVHASKANMVVTGGADNNIVVLDRATGQAAHKMKGHSKKVSPSSRLLSTSNPLHPATRCALVPVPRVQVGYGCRWRPTGKGVPRGGRRQACGYEVYSRQA
jgi:hypothetical protein